jgi:Protein of unknown function (DUF3363)
VPLRDVGFGKEVGEALCRRRVWLIEQELAREEQGRMIYRGNLLDLYLHFRKEKTACPRFLRKAVWSP